MNLMKQNKEELVAQITALENTVDFKDREFKKALDKKDDHITGLTAMLTASEKRVQRALGYIDHVNEDKAPTVEILPGEKIVVKRGPDLEDTRNSYQHNPNGHPFGS